MAITLRIINHRWFAETLSIWRAAFHRSIGVNAKKTTFIPVVIKDVTAISIYQICLTFYLIRFVNSLNMSLATLMVLALAWKPFWA